jgi:hypothetical protein
VWRVERRRKRCSLECFEPLTTTTRRDQECSEPDRIHILMPPCRPSELVNML